MILWLGLGRSYDRLPVVNIWKQFWKAYEAFWESRWAKRIFLSLSIAVLAMLVWQNRNSPFRGEHWALLYEMETAKNVSDWFQRVSQFVCFSLTRSQPLAFFPVAISYLLFGTHFWGHLLLSVTLHGLVAYQFVRLLSKVGKIGKEENWGRYSIEFSLFLILFAAVDVVTWTFFQYIQWALIFALGSLNLYFESKESLSVKKWGAYGLCLLATLLYEPFLGVLIAITLLDLYRSKTRVYGLVPLAISGFFCYTYSKTYVPHFVGLSPITGHFLNRSLYTGHDLLENIPSASHKILFVFYNYGIAVFNLLRSLVTLSQASKVNIYEFAPPMVFRNYTVAFGVLSLILVICFALPVFKREKRDLVMSFLLIPALMFSMIALGRTEDGNFPSVQFRYLYILIPFLLAVVLSGIRCLSANSTVYRQLLALAFLLNAGSLLDHSLRLRQDTFELQEEVNLLKSRGMHNKEIVKTVASDIANVKIPTRYENLFFTYNGRGGILGVLPGEEPAPSAYPYID